MHYEQGAVKTLAVNFSQNRLRDKARLFFFRNTSDTQAVFAKRERSSNQRTVTTALFVRAQ